MNKTFYIKFLRVFFSSQFSMLNIFAPLPLLGLQSSDVTETHAGQLSLEVVLVGSTVSVGKGQALPLLVVIVVAGHSIETVAAAGVRGCPAVLPHASRHSNNYGKHQK